MGRTFLTTTTVIALAVLSESSVAAQVAARTDSLSSIEAQADLAALRAALEEAHGGLSRFVSDAERSRVFEQLRQRLGSGISRRGFLAVVSEFVASLRDGHSRLELDSATVAELAAAPLLPIRVAIEEDQLVVALNESAEDTVARPGMRILSINGRPTSQLLQRLLPLVAGDGFIETGRRSRLARTFPEQLYLFADSSAEFRLELADASGRPQMVRMVGIRASERAAARNPVNATMLAARGRQAPGNVSLRFVAGQRVAHLRIAAFDGQTFDAALDSVFAVVRDNGTDGLILDLRGNGGGVDEYGISLVAHLAAGPFRYFDRIQVRTIRPSFATWLPRTFAAVRNGTQVDTAGGYRVTPALHPGVALQLPRSPSYGGRLIVLIDGGTFSTAADVAAVLRQLRRPTFVGEETGGTAEGNTSGLNAEIRLPHSRLRFKVYMYGYWNAVNSVRGRGVVPDLYRPPRVSDALAGQDPALDAALASLALGRSAPPH